MGKEEKGYVYILTNPAFRENWVKIGKSSRPVDVRSKELDNTAVPLPFQIYATMCTVKYAEAEKLVHKYIERFTNLRIRNNREFFNVKPEDALEIFYDVQLVIDDAEIEVFQEKAPKPKYKSKKEQANSEKEQAKPAQHIFYCKHKESKAMGYLIEATNEFVLLAGSELRSGTRPSLQHSLVSKRAQFIAEQCDTVNGISVLRANYVASSPSIAGSLILGRNTNGWTKWKDADGKTLDEVYRQT